MAANEKRTTKSIDWIFFDVGGVLINDAQYEAQRIKLILEIVRQYNPKINRADVLQVRPQASAMLGGLTINMITLLLPNKVQQASAVEKIKTVGKRPDHGGYTVVRPEAKAVVAKLSQKYRLGLLANQPLVTKEKLEKSGLLQYFTFQGVSEDFHLRKPDPEFFRAIFKATGADPKESAIIDDNIERGLIPAKALGMTTVWFTLEKRGMPKDTIDFTVLDLNELLKIFL